MNTSEYSGLNFERPARRVYGRLIAVGSALVGFGLLWAFVPHSTLFWLLLPVIGLLAWTTSYGWRQALASLHDLIHHLEQF